MKKILLIALLLLVGCEKPQREMIVEKWDNGTPKKVNYVIGEGVKQEIVGRITYYENGEFEIKGEYEKGKKHGKHEYYDENGQIIKVETYKDGKLDGKFTGWYESGQKRIAGSYKDGKHTGIWTSWDLSGVETSAADWFQKGYDAGINEEWDKAISFSLRAIELKPDYAKAYNNMGLVYYDSGNLTKAIESYNKAIEIDFDNADAYWSRSIAKDDSGDKSGGLEDTKIAARLGHQGAQDWLKENGLDW